MCIASVVNECFTHIIKTIWASLPYKNYMCSEPAH